jgi:hypothetical protein
MKIASLLACLFVACTMYAVTRAQTAKPELQLVDFNKLDKNHDGKLSRLEAQADPGLSMDFDALDANHDGYLSVEEFQAWPRAKKTSAPDVGTAPGGSSGAQHLPKY